MIRTSILSNIKAKNDTVLEHNIIEGYLFTGYSKKKLNCLSKTYDDLAKIYRSMPDENSVYNTRKDMLYQKQIYDTKQVFANHLEEMSDAFAEVADTMVHVSIPVEHKRKALIQYLKKHGIIVRELMFLESKNYADGKRRISIEAKVNSRYSLPVVELCSLLSEFFDRKLIPTLDSALQLTKMYDTFIFEDEPRYIVMSAIARAVKEDEKVSGDNFSLEEYNQNQVVAMIADGMGSGEQACKDSQSVIEFMEKFLEAGFLKEKALSMVNGAIASQTQGCNMTTLDICSINLLNGEAEFLKAGACQSYIKRRNRIDKIEYDTLPLGAVEEISPMIQSVKLDDSDILIMVTDGVADAFDKDCEKSFVDLLAQTQIYNPKELADYIIQSTIRANCGRIYDDMTVLVLVIWNNSF